VNILYNIIIIHTKAPFRSSSLLNAKPTSLAAPVTTTRLSLICISPPILPAINLFQIYFLFLPFANFIFLLKQLTARVPRNRDVSLSIRSLAATWILGRENLLEPIWKNPLFSFGDLRPRDLRPFVRVSSRARFVIHRDDALSVFISQLCSFEFSGIQENS